MRRSQRGDSIWPVVLLLFALALVEPALLLLS